MAEPIKKPLGVRNQVGSRQQLLDREHIGAT